MQLKVLRISDVADLATLAPIEFAAFVEDAGHNVMLGSNNPASIAATIARQKKEFTSDVSNFWIKVIDRDADDRIIATSNWKIYPTYVEEDFEKIDQRMKELEAKHFAYIGNEEKQEDAVIATRDFMSARHRNAKEAHIVLNLLFVDQEYHRKGAGRLMVNWGNKLADTMMLPAWVEASKQGQGLYASCGFEVAEWVTLGTKHRTWPGDMKYPLMRRPVMVSSW